MAELNDSKLNGNPEPVQNGPENGDQHEPGEASDMSEEQGSLQHFITTHFHDQSVSMEVSNETSELSQADEERRNNFFQRAVSESQRMSREVERHQQRHDQLAAELGARNLHDWTMEHASQVTVTLPSPSQSHTAPILEL